MNSSNNKLPTFSDITIAQIPEQLDKLLNENRAKINQLLAQSDFTWNNLIQPLDTLDDRLHQFWSPISHMNAVVNDDEIRKVYNECLPKLSQYHTEISHNQKLFEAIQSIADAKTFGALDIAQKKAIKDELRDFKLAGVTLPPDKKKKFAELVMALSQLATKFEENLLDATKSYKKLITDDKELAGIPETALTQAKERAQADHQEGWLFNLEIPTYLAIITHADSRELRKAFYYAYTTRASDQNADQSLWDNTPIMQAILSKRLELAQLLGFDNFAEESLATKMVKTPKQVLDFLNQLADASLDKAKQEYSALAQFAKDNLNLNELQAWDIAYASEKFRQHQFNISQEELRPYFSEDNVISGLFSIVEKLFQLTIKPVNDFDAWHPNVRCYALYDKGGELRSYFYFDLYARANKRGGAWMDDCRVRRKLKDGGTQLPIAFITCNFSPPTKNNPALFTHDEVVTLFHEFGHALQHMLTTIDYSAVSGINGIPWDAVELASQFLENWAWQKEPLYFFAKHFKTNEPLPNELFENLNKAKNFQSAMQMVRQLEFSLFDFNLHLQFDPQKDTQIQTILDSVRKQVCVVPVPEFNRFQHGFSHIFAGGYAAGYYSYKWAEVMASDAFSLFLEKGIFDTTSANKFKEYILQPGGSEEPAVLFKKYRGRDPEINSLLKQSGIINKES